MTYELKLHHGPYTFSKGVFGSLDEAYNFVVHGAVEAVDFEEDEDNPNHYDLFTSFNELYTIEPA